ncbi:MAG: GNAT family N-acetyltransferase, partial [Bilophila sp.]|nr:GNAT family N-acetyltransferase [Bilophila sp.]
MNPSPAHQTLPLVTERLRVRLWTEADRAAFRRMNADPRVMKFFPSTLSEAESDALLARIQAHQAEHGFTLWAVEDKATGNLAGLTGLARVAFDAPFTPCVEIGWRFLPEYWGTGYALEAARSVMGYAFKVLELPEVVAFTTESNLPSQGLMRRLGMLHNPAEDFDHPALPPDHPLHRHV